MARVAALLVLAFAVTLVCGSEFKHGSVVELSDKTFKEKVTDGQVWFIKFYAPWCGHCKRLAGTWSELADHYAANDQIAIAHVDCTVDKDTCTTAEIRGYPTLKVYYNGEEHTSYRGARDLDALKAFTDSTAKELLQETTE